MYKKILLPVLCVCLSAVAVKGLSVRQADAQQKAAATSTAVVDIRLAMRSTKEFEAAQAMVNAQSLLLAKEMSALKAELEGIQQELQSGVFKPGSQEYANKMYDFQTKKSMYEVKGKLADQRKSALEAQALLDLYRKTCARAGKLAEDRGYDLLLTVNLTDEDLLKAAASGAQRLVNGDREVIWAASTHNLTNDLVVIMNNEYSQRGAGSSEPVATEDPIAPAATPAATPSPVAP